MPEPENTILIPVAVELARVLERGWSEPCRIRLEDGKLLIQSVQTGGQKPPPYLPYPVCRCGHRFDHHARSEGCPCQCHRCDCNLYRPQKENPNG